LKRKANVLLIGQRGVGKSHLLGHIAEELSEKCYYIPFLQPAKSALTEALDNIMGLDADGLKEIGVSKMTLPQLADKLIEVIGQRDGFVLIIDALDKLSAANSEWLTRMAEQITILGALVSPKSSDHLTRFFWTFEMMEIQPLSDKDIKQIISVSVTRDKIQFADRSAQKLFLSKVTSNAKGIPLAALELCKKASNHTRKVSINFIRQNIRDHGASVKFIDATYLFIGLFGLIMAMRYISRGMGSMDAYTFWGAMSGILLVVRMLMMRSMTKRK